MNCVLWQPRPLEEDGSRSWKIGDAVFHVRHTGPEWLVARQAIGADTGNIPWRRWTAGPEERVVEPVPCMPDRSVMVKPEAPVHLAPGHTALFYVSIPLWVRITVGARQALTLCDEPTVTLSSLWFGEPTAGELCYSLRTRARRTDSGEAAAREHRAVSKVTMRNATAQAVEFQRLCLPARHLNVYRGAEHLWADDVSVVYEKATVNRVRIAGRPAEAGDAIPAGPSRDPVPAGHIMQRGAGAFRALFG